MIYDKYIKYEAAKELAEAEDNKNCVQQIRRRFFEVEQETVLQREKEKMRRCGHILERMVNQNVFNDISLGIHKDFRFFSKLKFKRFPLLRGSL